MSADEQTVAKIKEVIEQVRPSLQADGGDVTFISYENNIVIVELLGACGACPMSTMTLKQGIEAAVKNAVPEVISVENAY
jgi:Fe-S cluster biogenesis protein NfuA